MISLASTCVSTVVVENKWNYGTDQEFLMHTIHAYPAKFPAFIAQKAFEYAREEGLEVHSVADVFCGCGTVALEAKLHNVDFWGCDINPVAVLIAQAKSENYNKELLQSYYQLVEAQYREHCVCEERYCNANPRLQYWYSESTYASLKKLQSVIDLICFEDEKYKVAFMCIFSSILKATSRWLTKSIKPQLDKTKKPVDVWDAFSSQFQKFVKAIDQINGKNANVAKIKIEHGNFLTLKNLPQVDMIISSPPYVTSYEYADLHQLSTLWLGYTEDYRMLRAGSIGSAYNSEGYQLDSCDLNDVGQGIITSLLSENGGKPNAKVRAIARYYCDMQKAIAQCKKMLKAKGMVFFVVGDTEYKGVKIRNSEHLIQALMDEGFYDIKATKRIISNKLCSPYRDNQGRFSSDKSLRTIYHEEYIISARA